VSTFKIATYNVNSLRSRLHIVIPWLEKYRPDVFCMQETKVEDKKFPLIEFEKSGYHVVFKGAKQYNGVAVASLAKPDEVSFGLDDGRQADEERLIMCAFSGISVLNTYVPQGRDRESEHFAYKLEWFRRLKDFLDRSNSPGRDLIWCGDLNVAPEAIDVHDPKRLLGHVCFTPEVWDAFSLVKSWGLSDIFRKHHPDEPQQYTFFDYRVPGAVKRGLGWRIDHILATKSLAARSVNCAIDLEPRLTIKPSDHTVLTAEFEI
jgi:exodeoxyribonuclease III